MGHEQAIIVKEKEDEISPSLCAKFDVIDMPSKKANISNFYIFCLIMSIVTHIIDLVFDINVAYHYFHTEKYFYFGFTVFVILVPSLINNAISLRMHKQDEEMHSQHVSNQNQTWTCLGTFKNFLLVILQVAPLRHYWICLMYALKSRKCKREDDSVGQKQYYLKMVKENQDIALLTVFECFMETAPQQILQTTILLRHYDGKISYTLLHQLLSIASSFISMGWSMATYNRNIRLAQDDKLNIGVIGSILQFLWHLLVTISRIAVFTTGFLLSILGTGFFLLIHWIIMTTWLITESYGVKEFCRNRNKVPHAPLNFKERFLSVNFAFILGIVYIFVYINPDDNSTLMRHSFYYSFCFLENVIISILFSNHRDFCRFIFLLALCLIPYILGVFTMIIYYASFHPSKKKNVVNES